MHHGSDGNDIDMFALGSYTKILPLVSDGKKIKLNYNKIHTFENVYDIEIVMGMV